MAYHLPHSIHARCCGRYDANAAPVQRDGKAACGKARDRCDLRIEIRDLHGFAVHEAKYSTTVGNEESLAIRRKIFGCFQRCEDVGVLQ